MSATIIDGKGFALKLRTQLEHDVAKVKATHGITPGLAVVLVGENPASEVYVRNKVKQTAEVGMSSFHHHLPHSVTEAELLGLVGALNQNPEVHGILVQLPLPKHINEHAILAAIAPEKDVDGFHAINAGKLATGQQGLVPCTPLGCMLLLKEFGGTLAGKHAVILGRSNIVGKPMAQLLLREHCTVTIAHSRSQNVAEIIHLGDIVIAAVGQPKMVKGEWLKPGAVVVDVGINRLTADDGKTTLVGDCDFASCTPVASAITPVPGGVGPMTIACLLLNTLTAAKAQHHIP